MLRTVVTVAAFAVAVGCGDRRDDGSPPETHGEPTPHSTPAPANRPSRRQKFETVRKRIAPLRPWTESETIAVEALGPPDHVDGDRYLWYARDGKLCYELRLLRNGDQVAAVRLKGYPPAMQTIYARCKARLRD